MSLYAERISVQSPDNPERFLLSGVDCVFPAGGITLLAGRTGSGKSTLLHVLSGLRKPAEGNVFLDGQPLWVKERPERSLMMKSGIVFQFPEHQLFAETVVKEFEYSLRPFHLPKQEREQRMHEALHMTGLSEYLLERSPHTLSGGEKRKAAIATTLAARPDWLFLDEPTAGLDPQDTQSLLEWIKQYGRMKQTSGGIIIASHDLDLLLPLADQVVLLKQGGLTAALAPAELSRYPEPLIEAGVGLPSALRVAEAFRASGFPLEQPSFTPEEMGRQILDVLSQGHRPDSPETAPSGAEEDVESGASVPANRHKLREIIYALDPRAKWSLYMLFTIGVLNQKTWHGIAAGAVIFIILAAAAAVQVKKMVKPLKPFLWFMALSAIISGIGLGPAFDLERSLDTLKQLTLFLLIGAAGIIFSLTTSRRMIQQGLETMLSGFSRFRLPVGVIAFAASLLFRFVTIILAETERFSLIARARGKSAAKPGTLKWYEIPAFFLPLLLSVMQQAEDLAVAMDARGYNPSRSSQAIKLRFQKRDYAVIAFGFVIFAILIGINY